MKAPRVRLIEQAFLTALAAALAAVFPVLANDSDDPVRSAASHHAQAGPQGQGEDDQDWQGEDDDQPGEEEESSSQSAWLGVGLDTASNDKGAVVEQVYDGSPASQAGLQEGDVIVSFDGRSTPDASALTRAVREKQAGDRVTIHILRDGNPQTLNATLASRETRMKVVSIPGNGDTLPEAMPGHKRVMVWSMPGMNAPRAWMGVATTELTPELRRHFGAPDDTGVLVAQVRPGSPADRAGVRVGDVLTEVGGKNVDGPSDVADAIRDKESGDSVDLSVVREGRARTLSLTLAERPGMTGMKGAQAGGAGAYESLGRQSQDLRQRMEALQAELDDLSRRLEALSSKMRSSPPPRSQPAPHAEPGTEDKNPD